MIKRLWKWLTRDTDGGIADTYVLSVIGSKQKPTAYTDGLKVSFDPSTLDDDDLCYHCGMPNCKAGNIPHIAGHV